MNGKYEHLVGLVGSGDVGSVNYWTKKALEDPEYVASQVCETRGLATNILFSLQKLSMDAAIDFSTELVEILQIRLVGY
jgi:hypothetical protein